MAEDSCSWEIFTLSESLLPQISVGAKSSADGGAKKACIKTPFSTLSFSMSNVRLSWNSIFYTHVHVFMMNVLIPCDEGVDRTKFHKMY